MNIDISLNAMPLVWAPLSINLLKYARGNPGICHFLLNGGKLSPKTDLKKKHCEQNKRKAKNRRIFARKQDHATRGNRRRWKRGDDWGREDSQLVVDRRTFRRGIYIEEE